MYPRQLWPVLLVIGPIGVLGLERMVSAVEWQTSGEDRSTRRASERGMMLPHGSASPLCRGSLEEVRPCARRREVVMVRVTHQAEREEIRTSFL